jgi:hypothetical protein
MVIALKKVVALGKRFSNLYGYEARGITLFNGQEEEESISAGHINGHKKLLIHENFTKQL